MAEPKEVIRQLNWRREMTVGEVRIFESGKRATLKRFGYALATDGRRLPLFQRTLYRWHNAFVTRWNRTFHLRKVSWTWP
jgi:hypothetical protein